MVALYVGSVLLGYMTSQHVYRKRSIGRPIDTWQNCPSFPTRSGEPARSIIPATAIPAGLALPY